jgi:DNA-binding YbaB/EbfC family protein
MFQGLSNFANLMKQAREIQGRAAEMKERLARLRVEGSAGGGLVVVEVSGDQRLLACRIDPDLIASGDRELLEDLIVSAVNQALDQAREATAAEVQELAGGLQLPGLADAFSNLGLGGNGDR